MKQSYIIQILLSYFQIQPENLFQKFKWIVMRKHLGPTSVFNMRDTYPRIVTYK